MLIVNVKDNVSIDRSLKILKNKMVKTKLLQELRRRQEYVKPSMKRRNEIKKAVYNQQNKESERINSENYVG